MSNGYKSIRIGNRTKREHRYIYEQFLGRTLSPNEEIHHKNGNKKDNRISNLILMSRREHLKLHKGGIFEICKICKRSDRSAITIDLCRTCYMRERRRKNGATPYEKIKLSWGITRTNGKIKLHSYCIKCLKKRFPHRAKGFCTSCYDKNIYYNSR